MVAAVLLAWARGAYLAITHGRHSVRWLSAHTGVPALVVAAILVVVGWRVLKRTARFALEVVAVTAALFAATELGWIQW
jgi:hypothetical protein